MIQRYQKVRSLTEKICAPLQNEDYIPQPVYFASPAKWHLGHTTWFFEQFILKKFVKKYREYNPDFGFIFNSYYNTIGDRVLRAERGNLTRPLVEEVYAYRNHVDQAICELLVDANKEIEELLILGLNHEEQHQELLITDVKYLLGHNPLFPVYRKNGALTEDQGKENSWIKIEEGVYEIGHQGKEFAYDNELGRHKTYLHSFEIASELVRNEEYINFIEDGGYQRFELWLDEGWAWVNEHKITSPLYWHKVKKEWCNYTFAGFKKVDPQALLCHISYYEANAFACWKKLRLPTEFEWEVASQKLNWGKRWEWTNSAYLPYPKFKTAEGALGEYNGKFMINQMVLRGASVATSPNHSRYTYRNFFHPNLQWQFTGIRLAK